MMALMASEEEKAKPELAHLLYTAVWYPVLCNDAARRLSPDASARLLDSLHIQNCEIDKLLFFLNFLMSGILLQQKN
jgi:hypothetical protein